MSNVSKFYITAWLGVPGKFISNDGVSINKNRIDEMKEAGLNLIQVNADGQEKHLTYQILNYCSQLRLDVVLEDKRVRKAIKLEEKEEKYNILKSFIDEFKEFECIKFIMLPDEPIYDHIESIAYVKKLICSLNDKIDCYCNIFPNFAPKDLIKHSYEEYLEKYLKEVEPSILCYDHYHFLKPVYDKSLKIDCDREQAILEAAFEKEHRPGFYANFEICAKYARKFNIPLMLIILLVEHGPYRNLNKQEILWEVFVSLAYGVKQMSYFTYWTPGIDGGDSDDVWHWCNAMINKDGSKNQHYYDVKDINSWLINLGNYLFPLKYINTLHEGYENEEGISYYCSSFSSVSLCGNNYLIGQYENSHYLLVNKSYDKENIIDINLKNNKKAYIFDAINNKFVSFDNNQLILPPGEGRLILIK